MSSTLRVELLLELLDLRKELVQIVVVVALRRADIGAGCVRTLLLRRDIKSHDSFAMAAAASPMLDLPGSAAWLNLPP